eukprot:s15_g11.t1
MWKSEMKDSLEMKEDLAALLQTERSILVPLKSVCMQLGTLQARRFLHLALAQLSLHVDQFVECAKQFHHIFEARLFDSLRQADGHTAPAGQRPQKPPVQRSYRRAWQSFGIRARAQGLRREILKKVQKLGETVPLQSSEDEQFSIEKAQSFGTGPATSSGSSESAGSTGPAVRRAQGRASAHRWLWASNVLRTSIFPALMPGYDVQEVSKEVSKEVSRGDELAQLGGMANVQATLLKSSTFASCHSSFLEEMLLECDVKKMEAGTTLGKATVDG